MPVEKEAAVLGYFKFKSNTAWSLATRDWCNLSNMTGMYFGLEYGQSNTICWASLRGGGGGSLVIGGPLQAFGTARPAQQSFSAFNWLAQPSGTILEMWIVFSMAGYPAPFSPPNTPVLEVWTKRDGVDLVPVCHTLASPIPITTLGQFPLTPAEFTNYRPGPSDEVTLYFGNVGNAGDSLEMMDWALFPDYRVVVVEGVAHGKNSLTPITDSPYIYNCLNGRPQDVSPGRWFPMTDVGFLAPTTDLYFPPGRSKPSFVTLSKTLTSGAGVQRIEPRLEKLDDGAVIEAFMSAELIERPDESVGTGMLIDDGVNLFQVVMLETATRRTFGISKTGGVGDFAVDYFTPGAEFDKFLDWRSLKLVKLVVDRVRGKVSLFVDGVRYLNENLASMPPSTSPVGGRVAFGHVEFSQVKAKLNVAFLSYLSRYVAWELDEAALPDVAPAAFTLTSTGTGFQTVTATELQIGKSDFNSLGSRRYYSKLLPVFDERYGMQVDFKVKVASYTDRLGTAYAKKTWAGSGIQVALGNKKLHLGFFDCGPNGRVIGIIPGGGNIEDIINQTKLGRAYSAQIDWTASKFYRLIYRPYDRIEVLIDNVPTGPLITIPWQNDTDGFALPADPSIPAIAFGHFDESTSSTTWWEYFRYGVGNGYEVAVTPRFDAPLKSYLFGGRALVQSEFDE